jgi:hypothetical protein
MTDKEKLIYSSVGILLVLILINSTKSLPLKEVGESTDTNKNFDNSTLPFELKPPTRLSEGEPMPQTNVPKKSFSNISFKPRFDAR